MQYHVIHSSDPYLLARLCTDLQMEGRIVDRPAYYGTPFEKNTNYFAVYWTKNFDFISHKGYCSPIRHALTARNYTQVLIKILEQ